MGEGRRQKGRDREQVSALGSGSGLGLVTGLGMRSTRSREERFVDARRKGQPGTALAHSQPTSPRGPWAGDRCPPASMGELQRLCELANLSGRRQRRRRAVLPLQCGTHTGPHQRAAISAWHARGCRHPIFLLEDQATHALARYLPGSIPSSGGNVSSRRNSQRSYGYWSRWLWLS